MSFPALKIIASKSLSPRVRKWGRWIVGLLLFYLVAGFLILPPIIRMVAVKQLSQQLDREVTIQKVKLNPLTLSVTIRGLLVKDKNADVFIAWDEVYVNFQIASLFGHSWIFKEISTTRPYARVQMNKDGTFNFSDLVTKFSTNAPAKSEPSKPVALRIDRLHIGGASATVLDLTRRTAFTRKVGPIDLNLTDFRTDPENKNPYSFSGTTDAGEKFSWNGFFSLGPLRSQGELSLENLSLNKYAPLYQDFARFIIRDGHIDLHSSYRIELNPTDRIVEVTNTSFRLYSFMLAPSETESNIVELPEFAIAGLSADAVAHRAEVGAITASDARLSVRRNKESSINVVELSKPAETATNSAGGILLLLQSVTNAVSLLLNSTNQWTATVHDVNLTNCALSLEDLVNSRPARLQLDQISLAAKHISNVPGTNLTAAFSLRWNTNGTLKSKIEASFLPPTADIDLALDKIELRPLDPYLEPKFNLFVLDSKLGMDGHVRLRTTNAELPEVTFAGDVWLNDFSTVDGVLAEDLLKWSALRVSGIEANLNPPIVGIREIAVDDAYARLIIETNRTINLLTALRMTDTNAASPAIEKPAVKVATKKKAKPASQETAAASTNAPASLPEISIAAVVITNAQVRFTDRSLTPTVNLSIQQAGGTISGLSSEELAHAEVNLHARVDNVGPVEITGTINPLSKNQTNDIKISVKNVDLTPASPYVGKFAGYRLAKGKLGMDLAYHLDDRQLRAENVVVLDQFTFGEKVNSPEATKLPVRLAIAILKDRSGKITLDLPIAGSLDDPEFKLNKIIVHTLMNILTKVATSPFSMLGAIFGGAGEELSFQDFAPGSSELLPANKQKLDGLVKGLYERPALQLDIEGSINPAADLDGLRRVALEKRLRTMKWMSLRKSEQATLTADQITLTPDERIDWLRRAYSEALEKGELTAALIATNQSGAISNQTQAISMATALALAGRSNGSAERGASALMRQSGQSLSAANAPAGSTPAAAESAKMSPEAQMEQLLLSSISIGESDYRALASARARSVRDYLLQSGKVEAERLFLVDTQAGGVKNEGSRAYLQLK